MSLIYELNDLPEPDIDISVSNGKITVSPAQSNELDYIALGHAEDGIFLPSSFAFSPRANTALSIEKKRSPVLQAVDLSGRQGFWSLD